VVELANGNVGGPRAEVSLGGDDLVVECATQRQSNGLPRIEVVCGGDRSAAALGAAHRPVLVEGRSPNDGWLVDALGLVDIVYRSVGGDGAFGRGAGGGVIGAKVLDDVVLDERIGRPTVDGKVTVAARCEGTAEVDRPSGTGIPTLSTNKVSACAPGHTVFTSSLIGISDGGTTISPEGVVVAVVGAGAAWCSRASGDVAGEGDNSNGDGGGKDERSEANKRCTRIT